MLLSDHYRVAGVMTSLKPNNQIGLGRKEVNDLPLPFIAPLGPYDHDSRHGFLGGQGTNKTSPEKPLQGRINDPEIR